MLGSWKKKMLLLGGVAVVAAGGWAAQALAETPTPGATGTEQYTNYRQVFVAKLAAALGIDQQQLQGTFKQAAKETIDEAVKNGDLRENPAQRIKSRIDQQGIGSALGGFGHGKQGRGLAPHRAPGAVMAAMYGVILQAAADKLGMSAVALGAELKPGKSVADVAASKGIPVEEVRAAVVAAAKANLDDAVKAGKLTQEREDAILQKLQQGEWPAMHRQKGNRRDI